MVFCAESANSRARFDIKRCKIKNEKRLVEIRGAFYQAKEMNRVEESFHQRPLKHWTVIELQKVFQLV